ncbi:hypothetical protein [Haloferula sp. A504]|uniref:hypothetical protein n=1 Tax=Haloferula sp. A504 TaxID=3373601 RepID=UPI0031BE0F3E|nr:hypothetical protein [Verrucomicrobiaceae bacterium E54]
MARDYKVYAHVDALGLLPRTGRRRAAVLGFLQVLGKIAHLGGDYRRTDPETGRPYEVTEVAGFAVTWWIDAPVGEVKVVDIHSCDANRAE